jgi:hypothetical protein
MDDFGLLEAIFTRRRHAPLPRIAENVMQQPDEREGYVLKHERVILFCAILRVSSFMKLKKLASRDARSMTNAHQA